jgi:hypothetical protein
MQWKEIFYVTQRKKDPAQVHFERREESLLKKYRDPSALRPSAIHDGLQSVSITG